MHTACHSTIPKPTFTPHTPRRRRPQHPVLRAAHKRRARGRGRGRGRGSRSSSSKLRGGGSAAGGGEEGLRRSSRVGSKQVRTGQQRLPLSPRVLPWAELSRPGLLRGRQPHPHSHCSVLPPLPLGCQGWHALVAAGAAAAPSPLQCINGPV